jgi:hypothetical protein
MHMDQPLTNSEWLHHWHIQQFDSIPGSDVEDQNPTDSAKLSVAIGQT